MWLADNRVIATSYPITLSGQKLTQSAGSSFIGWIYRSLIPNSDRTSFRRPCWEERGEHLGGGLSLDQPMLKDAMESKVCGKHVTHRPDYIYYKLDSPIKY